ncbi:MAG TPA: general secretion pathway protein GspB [Ramlibacter sp.]|nr:general secretion pathway protein GspB [Ramlibacter sp.]
MSYILDALRRADAERERDPARGIHAQPAEAGVPEAGGSGTRLVVTGAAVLAAAAAAAVFLWPGEPPPALPVSAPLPPPPVSAAPPAPAVQLQAPAPSIVPAAPPPLPPPVQATATRPAAMTPAKPASAAAPAGPSERVFAVAELPADVQRELPRLVISGGVFSERAAQRMLIVGGQVVNEGAELAPGLVLEQIRPKIAVLRFRGWRYSVGY